MFEFVIAKIVKCQRALALVDKVYSILDFRIGFDIHYRAEDLILHTGQAVVWINNKVQRDFMLLRASELFALGAKRNDSDTLVAGFIYVAFHPVEVSGVDAGSEVGVALHRGVLLGND